MAEGSAPCQARARRSVVEFGYFRRLRSAIREDFPSSTCEIYDKKLTEFFRNWAGCRELTISAEEASRDRAPLTANCQDVCAALRPAPENVAKPKKLSAKCEAITNALDNVTVEAQ